MRVVFCITLQYVCTAVWEECIQTVIRDNINFFWDIGSPYKGNGDSVVRNTAMLCPYVLWLCLKCEVFLVFVLKVKGCVSKEKL